MLAAWSILVAVSTGALGFAGAKPDRMAPDAFLRPPAGCTLGIAGPTLDPATALRVARDDAFAALAAQRLGVELTSELSWVGARVRVRGRERTAGRLGGAWIAAFRPRAGGGLDAIACGAEIVAWPRGLAAGGGSWPPGFRRAQACALGIAGPGLGPGDRARLAWRDAREMLARSIETRVERALALDTGLAPERHHTVRATPSARRLVAEAAPLLSRRQWLDDAGRGPLRRPGLLYVELCLPEASRAWNGR